MTRRDAGNEAERFGRALKHPLRRRILRHLVGAGRPTSPTQTSNHLGRPLPNVAYHFRVLAECELVGLASTRPGRGSLEHFYMPVPGIVAHPVVKLALLEGGSV